MNPSSGLGASNSDPVNLPRSWFDQWYRPQVVRVRGMPADIIEYRGYQLRVIPWGCGFKVEISAPGALLALTKSPYSLDKSDRKRLITEARNAVDVLLLRNHETVGRSSITLI